MRLPPRYTRTDTLFPDPALLRSYDETSWHILRRHLTAERVLAAYAHLGAGPVTRYELPLLRALNFVIENALGGGVTRSLAQDMHGKSLSTLILTIEMPEAS